LVKQQIEFWYWRTPQESPNVDLDEILGRILEERGLPAIVDRDKALQEQTARHDSQVNALLAKLSGITAENIKYRKTIARNDTDSAAETTKLREAISQLESQSVRIDDLQGAGAAVVALSRLNETRESQLTAWHAFQPYALDFIDRRGFTRPNQRFKLSSAQSVYEELVLSQNDLQSDSSVPPGLLGGDKFDLENAREFLSLGKAAIQNLIGSPGEPYTPALESLLFQQLRLRQSPSTQLHKIFQTSRRHFMFRASGTPDANETTKIGLVHFDTFPRSYVYSWHPLEHLVVVYTWAAIWDSDKELVVSLGLSIYSSATQLISKVTDEHVLTYLTSEGLKLPSNVRVEFRQVVGPLRLTV
jgi:hypothetical protein